MAEVTIYTRMMCGYCVAAKCLLEKKQANFRVIDATFNRVLRREMIDRANGSSSFPQIFIGSAHIGGCDELHALDHAGRLDAMLVG